MNNLFKFLAAEKGLLIPHELYKNNFDFIRFFLAAAVIYSHSYIIYYGRLNDIEPVSILTRNQINFGGIAVNFFFVISGFLIVKSFESSKGIFEYFSKRVLRICPGFYVAFLVSVFVFGALGTFSLLHTTSQWDKYWDSMDARKMIVQFLTLEAPRDIKTFGKNPMPNRINSSLWTIQYEFICYLLVPLFGLVSMIKRKWLSLIFFLLSYTVHILQSTHVVTINDDVNRWVLLYPSAVASFFTYFFGGSNIYFYRNYITRNNLLVLLSIISILFASWWGKGIDLLLPVAGTYLVFYFAYNPRIQFHEFAKRGDFSYGLYLYGWPVHQVIMYIFGRHISMHLSFFIALTIAFIAAYLSWHWIENPFLKMKGQIGKMILFRQKVSVISKK